MLQPFTSLIASALRLDGKQIHNALRLLSDGATIPFISRYRKEATGGMDEVQLAEVKAMHDRLCELQKRKETIVKTIEEAGRMTPELQQRIADCWDAAGLEDLYLPFVRGEVGSVDEALKGARDIMAEWVNESEAARQAVRGIFAREAVISSRLLKGKEAEGQKYRDYFEADERLSRISSHRLLAMRRGEAEGVLRVSISPDDGHCTERLRRIFVRGQAASSREVALAVDDAYKRLLKPSMETEFAAASKQKADTEAIRVFAGNLRQLLLAPPLGQKRVLAIDPGYRTGCKVVCLDAQGNLLHNETLYPHPPQNERPQAMRKLQKLVEAYDIQAVAIGNGTAGRETEQFVQSVRFDRAVQVFVVSEDGASIYSASKTARDEFPDYDVTVRGAVSIGRRLMDPLAELVKIDPKSIGVGQYQHDVDQTRLKEALDQAVENAVNRVGVNLNTASKHLLMYVSGLGPQLAQNIVDYRAANGAFTDRHQLLKVPKMGAKTFEQCAGFLRITGGRQPLDNSAVHPESYAIVEAMARDLHTDVARLVGNGELLRSIDLQRYVGGAVGLPTLTDIVQELEKPGRDPRSTIQVLEFDPQVKTIADLRPGMELPGIVTNVTNFGAFTDIGIKEKGLIHISQLADRYVSNPAEVVALHQHVRVRVLEVDCERKRIQLKLLGKE